jgi:hypothetical protein
MALTGHRAAKDVSIYVRAAEQSKLAVAAMAKLASIEVEQIFPNSNSGLGKRANG